jgi:hypothetical protein
MQCSGERAPFVWDGKMPLSDLAARRGTFGVGLWHECDLALGQRRAVERDRAFQALPVALLAAPDQ